VDRLDSTPAKWHGNGYFPVKSYDAGTPEGRIGYEFRQAILLAVCDFSI
jgi:hypothetical protein